MEPISLFLNAFIQLADRINNLEKTKLQDQKVVFEEIVEPLFTELEPIAKSYTLFFRKARQLIIDKNKPSQANRIEIPGGNNFIFNIQDELHEMARYLKEERDTMANARIKVSEMAGQIKEHINNPEIVEFSTSVEKFFFNSPGNFPEFKLPRDSKATEFLERLDQSILSDYDDQDLIKYIDRVLHKLENSWGEIVRSYQKLKIILTSPPTLIRKH